MIKSCLIICLLAISCCGCSALFARTRRLEVSQDGNGKMPERGLRVISVFDDSPAQSAGIQKLDVITQYGDYQIVDDASFFAARNHYDEAHEPTVEIVVWRGSSRMTGRVRSGWLGVDSVDNDRVSQNFLFMMKQVTAQSKMPGYMEDVDFKERLSGGPVFLLKNAREMIDQAERDNSLTPAQVLVDRIYLILDDASPKQQQYQAELLTQLLATQPVNYIQMLGQDKFFNDERYRPAAVCLNHYLKTSPDDVSMRLNLAVAYNHIQKYEEADKEVDYVFAHLRFSEYGRLVGNQAKAVAALGQKDYQRSLAFAEKAYAYRHESYPLMLEQLAAAQLRDRERFVQAAQQLQEDLPNQFAERKLELAAVDAYSLSKSNSRDEAQKIVNQWKDTYRTKDTVASYWLGFPGGIDVARNWVQLMKN